MTGPRIGSLFSGYGGLCELAVTPAIGGTVAWHVEKDAETSKLGHHWPTTPNYGDITAVDWAAVEPVDWLVGGFPCQDVSSAGKGAGLRPGTRTGLWSYFAYAIGVLRPRWVLIENVAGLRSRPAASDLEPCPGCVGDGSGEPPLRALGAVVGDLSAFGYDARWVSVRACDAGAPHNRERVFVLAADARGDGQARHPEPHLVPEARLAAPRRVDVDGRGVAVANPPGRLVTDRPDGRTAAGFDVGAVIGTGDRDRTGDPAARIHGDGRPAAVVEWGAYTPAIERWERILGRPAPVPFERGTKGQRRLVPTFLEWEMGLPEGHVTTVPDLGREAQMTALGNGVVPQQAALAVRVLLARAEAAA